MKPNFWNASLALAVGLLCAATAPGRAEDAREGVTLHQVEGAFEDVRFDLENAIVNRGLVIDYVSHIGDMLARTGSDVGSDAEIFSAAQSMLFCSANLSRKVMEADPLNIAYCPYSVFVYERADAPGTISVGFRHLQEVGSDASKAAIAEVNALLAEIVEEAAEQ